MSRTAVVLFNLGGPDSPEAVRPFLFNLFNDKAIIGAPAPIRFVLASLISTRRAPVAREIYSHLGGGSPILANTQAQAEALSRELDHGPGEYEVFICMRYWHPRSEAVVAAVKKYGPSDVVLLPLYPQYSTTTTGSALADWSRAAGKTGLQAPTRGPCCYPTLPGFIEAVADGVKVAIAAAKDATSAPIRVLFSAHGLPKRIVAAGDPYQWQVERTAAAVVERLGMPGLDWVVCYQSRVGPLEWIGPATDEEIGRAGRDGVAAVVAPVAFVSEHSETLVELDIEYGKLARLAGVPAYVRAPTVGTAPPFIRGLASLVRDAKAAGPGVHRPKAEERCPAPHLRCPQAGAAAS
ncbi:MAG: ferrochelatase [Alphaproteobacteria bacterium]